METGVLVPRTPRDDFESLLFSIWTVAGMGMDPSGKPEAMILAGFRNRTDAKSRFVVSLRSNMEIYLEKQRDNITYYILYFSGKM